MDSDDRMLISVLNRIKGTVDPPEIRQLSDQIERVVFHKQLEDASPARTQPVE